LSEEHRRGGEKESQEDAALKRSSAAIISSATGPAPVRGGRLAAVLRVAGHEAVLVQHDGVGGAAPEERVVLVLAVGGEAALREGSVDLGLPCCDCRCYLFIVLLASFFCE